MSGLMRSSTAAVLLAVVLSGGPAWAENEGQEDLDRATETKLDAKTLSDLDEVIRLCESALQKGLDEENTEFANMMLGSTLVQRGSIRAKLVLANPRLGSRLSDFRKGALEDLEKAVELNPKQPQALLTIAQLNRLPGGDARRAAEALEKLLGLDLDQPKLRAKALVLHSGMEQDPAKKLAELGEAIQIAPGYAAALRARGLVHAGQGKLEPALADFDKAIELDPKHAPTYEAKAVTLAMLKKYDEALASLDKARDLDPNSVELLLHKARIHAAQKNLDAALIDLDLACSIDPDSLQVLLLRAGVYEERGETEKALADMDQVLNLKPDFTPAMRLRATLLADAEKFDEAIAELERLRQRLPDDVTAALQLGMLHNAAKKLDEAVKIFSAILDKDPDNWMALRGRGDALLNSGRQTEAIADYERALKFRPKDVGVLNNLAWVLATSPDDKLRSDKRAIKLATEACELTDYEQAHILSTLGAAYAETGDFETAIKWTQKGIEVANEEQKEPLGKELESYRAGKPWRELLVDGEPVEEKPVEEQAAEKN